MALERFVGLPGTEEDFAKGEHPRLACLGWLPGTRISRLGTRHEL